MKLISLTSNMPSFKSIMFKDGVNIIIGKQAVTSSENDGNTYNGVGKSLILHLIHFCLGCNKITSFEEKLEGWEFTLKFEINSIQYTCTRSTQKQNTIIFNGEELKPRKVSDKIAEICFPEKNFPGNMTFTTLFSRFVRRFRSSYLEFDSYTPKESDYSKILNNAYLLGLETNLIVEKKQLRDKQINAEKTLKAIKNDEVFKQYYLGKEDAELDKDDISYKIRTLEKEIELFIVSNNYHEIEKEADEKSYHKKVLENKRALTNTSIKNIVDSLNYGIQSEVSDIYNIYESANIEIPSMVKRSLDEVISFHHKVVTNRDERLSKDLSLLEKNLSNIDKEIEEIGREMDALLVFLNTHGALDEYTSLNKQLMTYKQEESRLAEYQNILKSYTDLDLEIKEDYLESNKSMNLYLTSEHEHINKLKELFQYYAKLFYPKKASGLVIKNNTGENTLRCEIDARIQADSSDGVNEVRIFCFDLLILLTQISEVRFMMHDSRIFANMDPRQREALFRVVMNICLENDLQYICTINEDAILSFKSLLSKEEFESIIKKNTILELNDDSAESKLLGIEVDILLEKKKK